MNYFFSLLCLSLSLSIYYFYLYNFSLNFIVLLSTEKKTGGDGVRSAHEPQMSWCQASVADILVQWRWMNVAQQHADVLLMSERDEWRQCLWLKDRRARMTVVCVLSMIALLVVWLQQFRGLRLRVQFKGMQYDAANVCIRHQRSHNTFTSVTRTLQWLHVSSGNHTHKPTWF